MVVRHACCEQGIPKLPSHSSNNPVRIVGLLGYTELIKINVVLFISRTAESLSKLS
jgi:hypothetical protein